MTQEQFLLRYRSYRTQNGEQARQEAARLNAEGVDGNTVVALEFPRLGWTLMLEKAVSAMHILLPDDPTFHTAENE